MSDYGTMQTRIANELARADLSSYIKDAIKSAVSHYSRHHFWFNETTGTFNTADGTEYYAVVTTVPDFVEIDSMVITVNGNKYPLVQRDMDYIDAVSGNTSLKGVPTDYCYYKESIRLYPIPNGVYTITMAYVKKFADLSATADTNAFMTTGEQLIRSRAKADLMTNYLMDYQGAGFMKRLEQEAYDNLLSESAMKLSTGCIKPTQF